MLLAWIMARTNTPFRAALEVLITLPFFIPPILTAMAWGMLGNPQVGVHQSALAVDHGIGDSADQRLFLWRRGLAHDAVFVPFLFLFIVEAFRAMDPALEEAASMCGASRLRTFRSVTLQLMLPALTGAAIC